MMLEMEYSDSGDTVSLANKNRAASKKIFEQLQQSSRSPVHIAIGEGHMLHRQPSGAQKRIRQRQEQKWLKAVSVNSTSNSSSNVRAPPAVPEKSAYRSLIDSGGYKSILPDEPPFTVTSPSSSSSLPRNTFVRSASITSMNKASSTQITVLNNASAASPIITGGKPTVQVHPMPSSLSAGNSTASTMLASPAANSNMSDKVIREKPAVPKKPAKLILSSATASVEAASMTPLSLSTSSLNFFPPSSQSSPSTSSSFRLFSSPSFMCLHSALMQPSLTDEEVERLDAKRKKLIESISRKVAVLDEERNTLDEDCHLNEILKDEVFNCLMQIGESAILEKLEQNLAQNSQLCRLETRLRMQLERLQSISQSNENADKELIGTRIDRLKRQLEDQTVLRRAFDRRDAEVDKYVLSRLSDEKASQWRIYKDTWKRLIRERQEIDERLILGREQINALRNAQPHL